MTIYIVVNNCPHEFGEHEILDAFISRENALQRVNYIKRKDPYQNQYVEIVELKVEDVPE